MATAYTPGIHPGQLFDFPTLLFGGSVGKNSPRPNSYEQRIQCLQKLLENQKAMANLSRQSLVKTDQLSFYQKEYRDLYAKCESIMKP